LDIKQHDQDQNTYTLHAEICNTLTNVLKHNPTTNEWKSLRSLTTYVGGSPEEMEQEYLVSNFMSSIKSMEIQDDQSLLIQTNDGDQVKLERFIKQNPEPVTQNIFSELTT
jgi:hypothetical protein